MSIDTTTLTAIDVHVHLEAPEQDADSDTAARQYFGRYWVHSGHREALALSGVGR